MNDKTECGERLHCHVCERVIEADRETWAYFHAMECEVPLCPDHADVRDHTCQGMTAHPPTKEQTS